MDRVRQKGLSQLGTPGIPASSWTDTDQYRGEIRKGAQHVLDELEKAEANPDGKD
jgi:hypothetical protein